MEVTSFADENFDAKAWVNTIFQNPDALNKEAFASSMVVKLQLFIQEINSAIDDTSQQVLQNLPRVVREAEAVRQEATLLRDRMKSVKDDIEKVERETAHSMQTLIDLDTIKSRMQDASKAFQEADNWSSLSADVDHVFRSGDVNAISSKLVGMQQSLTILTEVPDFNERCQLLDSLKDKLEAMLTPQLVAALNTQSVDAALLYMRIFNDIQRGPQLQVYYHKCHKTQLLQKWQSIVEADPEETLIDWLTNFYDHLLSTWHTQLKWCGQVFASCSPVHILSKLFIDVMRNVDPSLSFCLEAALKQHTSPLLFIVDLKQVSDRFARSLEASIQSINPAFIQDEHVRNVAEIIYAVYKSYIRQYGTLEERWLNTRLKSIFAKRSSSESVTSLGENITKTIAAAKEAENRCCQAFHGCTYTGLRQALQIYLGRAIDSMTGIGNALAESITGEVDGWTKFQHSVLFIQSSGDLVIQIESLDQLLATNFLGCVSKYCYGDGSDRRDERSSFKAYESLLLELPDRRSLESLLTEFQKDGDPSLLQGINIKAHKLCQHAIQASLKVVLALIHKHLANLPTWQVWSMNSAEGVISTDLPSFSLSPQEHITQIGQCLMTIPQHIEPFILEETPGLEVALKHAQAGKPHRHVSGDGLYHVADALLDIIVQGVMVIYTDAVMKIPRLTTYSAGQLATDIEYLCNVLDDLGIRAQENLQHLAVLMRASPQEFHTKSEGKPSHIVALVQSVRGLNTTLET